MIIKLLQTEDENADDVDMDGESLADSSVSGVTDPDDMSEAY